MAEDIEKNKTTNANDSQVKQVTKEYVYNCDQCDKTYIQQKRLETHMKEKHSGSNMALKHVSRINSVGSTTLPKVTCKMCKYVSNSNMMQIHVGLHHK